MNTIKTIDNEIQTNFVKENNQTIIPTTTTAFEDKVNSFATFYNSLETFNLENTDNKVKYDIKHNDKSSKKKNINHKKSKKNLGDIVVLRATSSVAIGKYGTYIWKAKNIDGHWKIRSKIPLTVGQKSSVSAKINNYLEDK
jgi:hypothetical protein